MTSTQTALMTTFTSIQRFNRVSIADLLDKTGLDLVTLHGAIQSLRCAGILTATGIETEVDERTYSASIREDGRLLAWVSKRI